jgi:hypothetical protein
MEGDIHPEKMDVPLFIGRLLFSQDAGLARGEAGVGST